MNLYEQSGESMPVDDVILAAHLPFGRGEIGKKHPLQTPEEKIEFARQLQPSIRPLTIHNTADCVEDRPMIALADGTTDPDELARRVTYQLPGGLALAFTKAAVGADAAYLRDARDFKDAYIKTVDLLAALGYRDSAHNDCGADKVVEESVAHDLSEDQLMVALPALTAVNERTGYYIARNWETKRQRLGDGFYGGWDPAFHVAYVSERFPDNSSIVAEDPTDHATNGHHASGAAIIQKPGYGFAKTDFYNRTGRMAFGMTPNIPVEIIHKLAGSEEERARIALELQGVDPQQVFNNLVVEGFPAFAKAA
jgi:hypothetical protein